MQNLYTYHRGQNSPDEQRRRRGHRAEPAPGEWLGHVAGAGGEVGVPEGGFRVRGTAEERMLYQDVRDLW